MSTPGSASHSSPWYDADGIKLGIKIEDHASLPTPPFPKAVAHSNSFDVSLGAEVASADDVLPLTQQLAEEMVKLRQPVAAASPSDEGTVGDICAALQRQIDALVLENSKLKTAQEKAWREAAGTRVSDVERLQHAGQQIMFGCRKA